MPASQGNGKMDFQRGTLFQQHGIPTDASMLR
jgi:hypothetical protein